MRPALNTSVAPVPWRSGLWALAAIVAIALGLRLWGIKGDLPFVPHVDEPVFVVPAVEMAAKGNANPGWFGHPGSTVIYPLAAAFRAWSIVANGGARRE